MADTTGKSKLEKVEKVENKLVNKIDKIETSIQEMPSDILNKILYHTQDSIEDKIDRIENIRDLYSINKIIHQRIES